MADYKIPTPTHKPVPSADIRDVVFAGAKVDEWVTSPGYTYTDRFGKQHLTAEGINNQFQQFLLNSGYEFLADYADGPITFTSRNQITAYNGEYYRPKASVSLPYTTTGNTVATWSTDKDNFVVVGDAALRQELAADDGEIVIGRIGYCSGLVATDPKAEGKKVTVIEFEKGSYTGGGEFISKLSTQFTADSGKVFASANSAYVWVRIEYLAGQPIQPEWYGCRGLGSAYPDTASFMKMISGLEDNDTVLLGMGREYYNDDPYNTRWAITKNNISIVGQGSTLSRRTMLSSDGFGIILDVQSVTKFYLGGRLHLAGNDPLSEIYNTSGVSLNSGVSYSNSPVQTFCIRIENSSDVVIGDGVTGERATYIGYINGCTRVSIKGSYRYSGQVYPLTGSDLSLGSAFKFNNSTEINTDITADNCAYSGVELEGYNYNGTIKVRSKNNYHAAAHLFTRNANFTVDVSAEDCVVSGIFIGNLSRVITGKVSFRSINTSAPAVFIQCTDTTMPVTDVSLDIVSYGQGTALTTYATTIGKYIYNNKFNVISERTATTGSHVALTSAYYNEISIRAIGGARCLTLSSGNFNDFILKPTYGVGTVYQSPGWYNNFDITSMTSEGASTATRYVLRYEQAIVEGSPSVTSNSPESMLAYNSKKDYATYPSYPNIAHATAIPTAVPVGGLWVDTDDDNTVKWRAS
ncbi:hypothetical protein [Tatumella citrea]|uniref:Tail spike TSP1/Gp66 N-terminal domain-containing protein n=1 Tax=Tatumella citrea TaxID=53336 RepID=A0A1Y0L9C8_TATCI|nr:hypothetical protein [Tatumella citrea]ARU94547.1 hypothetical protein A7K98_12710 [Tatumella citrea]ARU98585.1 hypothetical protein A7K99_12700 [Tatumella citrea]